MNPETWEHPEEFRPERFLSEDLKTIHKPEHFLPFGIGQRMCLGDQLAEKEFFMFFASLLHCYELKNPQGQTLPDLRGVTTVTVSPREFEVICSPRRHVPSLTSSLLHEESTQLWLLNSQRIYGWYIEKYYYLILFYYYFYIIIILQYPIIFFTNILHNKQRNKKYPYFLL